MKIALLGYGKMGKAINAIIRTFHSSKHEIVLKIKRDNKADLTVEALKAVDVAIEFSNPESAVDNILMCFKAGVPVVVGTTGWLNRWKEVEKICLAQNGCMLYASNFSIGMNLLFNINAYAAQLMAKHTNKFNVYINEVHHHTKKDQPSGTAITLAEQLIEHIPEKQMWQNKFTPNPKTIGIISNRPKEDIKGIHAVCYFGEDDVISIQHMANNRNGFARGAILAAVWLVEEKRTGIFSMADVLS